MFRPLIALIIIPLLIGTALIAQDVQIRTRVELVVVPVSVKDGDRLVTGLTEDDFTVMEDGRRQKIANFSIDPQPLSAVILVDTGMGGISLRRLAPLFVAVTGGFSEFDEMAAFRYDHLVHQLSDFTKDPAAIEKSFAVVKKIAETQPDRVPGGTPAPTAPKILQLLLGALGGANAAGGAPVDPTKPPAGGRPKPVPTSRVLYDALYDAAKALEKRPPEKRRMIFIISDGAVAGTMSHNLDEVTTLLLKDEIQLYAVTTDFALTEGRFSVLASLARATGGDSFGGGTTNSMEQAFLRITEQARNQYVIGYHSNNLITNRMPVIRTIEVTGRDPGWNITHRRGYTQLP